MATVLVLGGGIGGSAAANALRARLRRGHRIIVIDRDAEQVFAPSLLWLMVGQRRPADISRPLAQRSGPGSRSCGAMFASSTRSRGGWRPTLAS